MFRLLFLLLFLSAFALGCGGSTDSDPGSGGQTGTGGKGGGGGSGGSATCTKICNGKCVPIDDPSTGCGTMSCEPCNTPHATAVCSAGQCVIGTCDPGYENCDVGTFTTNATGCETQVAFDVTNCGACGVGCTSSGGSVACINSSCQPDTCPLGSADCTGQGTCSSLATFENCGACGKSCETPNATGTCLPTPGGTGICSFGCNPNFSDCDAIEANGCETNVATDLAHCGACGTPCTDSPNSTAVCAGGTCSLICDAGYSDCDGNMANGCEKPASSC